VERILNVAVIDVSNYLYLVRNRVNKVGVEIEGAWIAPFPNLGSREVRWMEDGSVFDHGRVLPPGLAALRGSSFIGEAPSPALDPISVPAWIRRCYPRFFDHTCGLHVHMSFRDSKHYEILASNPSYQDTLLHHITEWAKAQETAVPGTFPPEHHIWGRLAGDNEYCQVKWWPEQQTHKSRKVYERDKPGHRYTAINFCYSQHKTVECRVLPVLPNAELAVGVVMLIINITNACLVALAMKTEKVIEEVYLSDNAPHEEIDQEMI
jgi:hypothetical protein